MCPTDTQASLARRLLGLIDLTSLNDNDDAASVAALAALGVCPAGRVAAFCTWPRFLASARESLRGSGVPIAAVSNFPAGSNDASAVAAETAAAIAAGADEIDVVFPYHAFLAGDRTAGLEVVSACRAACTANTVLKVILETGQLRDRQRIQAAAHLAIEGGAHFLKTSTGKTAPGATLEAAAALIEVIAAARADGRSVGLKVSGGVSSMAQAEAYLRLFEQTLGPGSATAASFRIGTSTLIRPVLAALQ